MVVELFYRLGNVNGAVDRVGVGVAEVANSATSSISISATVAPSSSLDISYKASSRYSTSISSNPFSCRLAILKKAIFERANLTNVDFTESNFGSRRVRTARGSETRRRGFSQ